MYMIMFVLNDSKKLDLVLEGWSSVGVNGVTILQSTGAYRRRMRIPGRYAYTTAASDENNETLMAMIEDEETVLKCLEATKKMIGDLSQPNTGIFTYWPLTAVEGIRKNYPKE